MTTEAFLARTSSAPGGIETHRGFARVFQPARLSFGFIMPLEGYPDSPAPTMRDHLAMAQKADEAGFSALWLRDVPFYDPSFGDVGQVFDPMVYAGFLAGVTSKIAIGTAGVVMPLRDPLAVAKQSTTLDHLTEGRFLLGLSTGDRPSEYPVFGAAFDNRADRFRDAHALIRAVTEQDYPRYVSEHYGRLDGSLDMVPKPIGDRLPIVAIGRAGQSIEWLGANMDGWIWHQSDFDRLGDVVARWRAAIPDRRFKPYGYGAFFDLDRDPDAPMRLGRGLAIGRKALIDLWKRQQEAGVSHVALNLKASRRPTNELLDELGEYVLPHFDLR